MDGERPDRVPLMCQMSFGHMLLQAGLEPAALWNSAEVFAEGLLRLRQRYGFDGILVSLHGHSPDWENGVSRIEKDLDKQVIHWKNGDRTVFPCDDLPIHYPASRRRLPVLSEIDPASIPDEIPFIPVSQNLEFPIDPGHRFDIFEIMMKKAGEEFSIHGEVTSPFDYFLNLFGFREALIGLIDDPPKAKEIIGRYAEAVTRLAVRIAGQGVDAIKVSSPYAGAGFISPLFYQEFVAPFEGQIASAVRRRGLPVYIHTCGAINDRLELMAAAGFSGIECLDPPPLGNVELDEAKKRVGERVFIKGNIDPVNVLLLASRESVREDARWRLEVGKPGGRFILSTACSIAPHTPRENVEVLSEVIEREGSY
ncbi:MAG: uroporphyrinogen decarboxylase family protein [Clostridiales bacterium]|nr:uroporphyrinogen decarboxylase family protein [Clostridiales bacterium]